MNNTSLVLALALMSTNLAAAPKPYSVSCITKDDNSPFLNRLATATHHVIVSEKAVKNAVESLTVAPRAGESWFLVEGRAAIAHYPGEVGRVCGIIVAHSMTRRDDHSHDKDGNYIEAFGSTMQTPPAARAAMRFAAATSGTDSAVTIDPEFLKAKLEAYSGARPVTLNGVSVTLRERGSAEGKRLAREFLRQEYEAMGYRFSTHTYGNGGINVIAERAGTDPSKVLIVSAHLDSVSNAGADDDGAGIISGLAVANALKDAELKISLRFVGFDEEEKGLLGSTAYASYLNAQQQLASIAGIYNLEMTAYDSDNDGGFHVIDCNENTSANLTRQIAAAVSDQGVALRKVQACTNRSDHAAFWRYNIPAIVISENFFGGDGNPCYHRACDKTGSLNFEYMRKITVAVAAAVGSTVTANAL